MPPDRKITLTLVGLVALGLLAVPASAVAQQPFDRLACGTWLMMITVPPNPLLGNAQPVQMPEYASFGIDGTGVHIASTPGFPVPVDGNVVVAMVTNGWGNWESDGRRLVATEWRFVTNPATGDFLGFFKVTFELEAAGRSRLQGNYFLEILDAQLQPRTFGGQALAMGGPVVASRVAAERMPRR